ncbi:reverse transcriptase (RNA-dependent DNA polymerase) domain-containing protein [Phthorimaea operculella]|nr:reverse transcriptase (RNA-dependent DNA polymerase) domain-containing protein [Phthorimaea operculella]
MPVCKSDNLPEFSDCLCKMHSIAQDSGCSDTLILGDFNADFTTIFGRELMGFCEEYGYVCIDSLMLPTDTYTFVSDAHGTVSWLDHCLTTEHMKKCMKTTTVDYQVTWTDHRPIQVTLNIDGLSRMSTNTTDSSALNPWAWKPRDDQDIARYTECMTKYLPYSKYNREPNSNSEINNIYESLITAMQSASRTTFQKKRKPKKYKHVAGWSKHVAESYERSRVALISWHSAGRPRDGELAESRKLSRSTFKKALTLCQQEADQHKMDSIANCMKDKNFFKFWQKTNNICKSHCSTPSNIDGVTDNKSIANLFINKFTHAPPAATAAPPSPGQPVTTLPTSSASTLTALDAPTHGCDRDNDISKITPKLLHMIIRNTARGKSPGHDGLSIEHIKYLGLPMCEILCQLFKAMIRQTHIPTSFAKTVIVPICKDKQKGVTHSNNYRPIALAAIIARLFEKVIHNLSEKYLTSSDHQMGFKSETSTSTAIYVVKQVAHYYKHRNTSVIACYLDLSKAFDRVSHSLLWKKLYARGMPENYIKILEKWHELQTNTVRWNVHGWEALMRHTTARAAERIRTSTNTIVQATRSWVASPIHAAWRRLQHRAV